MNLRFPRRQATVELCLALLAFHVFLLAVLQRYGFESLGIPLSFRDPLPALVLMLGLLLVRWMLDKRDRDEPTTLRQRLVPGRWLRGLGAPGLILATALFAALYLFHHHGGRLGNDGSLLYVYVRSLVMDGDLDFTNEFEDFVPGKFQFIAEQARSLGTTPDPLYEPGPALLWAPWFVFAHAVVVSSRAAGGTIPADGYSYPYINAVCLGSLVWAFVAVVLSYRVAARYFAPRLAAVCVAVLWFGTTLVWYSVYNPSMPHAVTAAAVAIFVVVWLRFRESPTRWTWLALGLSAGLILSMQRYNVFFLAAPLLTIAGQLRAVVQRKGWVGARRYLGPAALATAGFLLMAAPLFIYNVFYTRDGTLFRWGESLGAHYLRFWSAPRIGEFLFSSNHGLFSWTPLIYLSVIGLFLFLKKDRKVGGALLVTLGLGIYLLSSTWDWYAGSSFGSRRMTEAFIIFAVGFCAIGELVLNRPKLLALGGAGVLVAWNFLLAGQVRRGEVPDMGTFAFSDAASRAAARYYERFGHPASVPANWWFAREYGVSPDRFDAIYGHREYHNLRIDVGSYQDRSFLGRGWSRPEQTGDRSWRWSLGSSSTFLVPLFDPYDYRVRLTGEPSRHPEGARQAVFVSVNGKEAAHLRLNEGWQTTELVVPASFWKSRLNEIRFDWLWTVEAGEAYGGNDSREIAFKLETLELEIVK